MTITFRGDELTYYLKRGLVDFLPKGGRGDELTYYLKRGGVDLIPEEGTG